MEKAKRKSKPGRIWWNIEGRRDFEYISRLPVDECARQLEARNQRGSSTFASHHKQRVTVQQQNADVYHFTMDKDAGRNLAAEINGTMESRRDGGTLIYGTGRISMVSTLLTLLFAFLFGGGMIGAGLIQARLDMMLVSVFPLGMFFMFHLITLGVRDAQIRIIEETLVTSGEKQKRQME